MLTDDDIVANKLRIIDLLKQTEREGIHDYIKYIENSDFFLAPASTKYHRNYPGGLAEHCLNLLELLKLSNSRIKKSLQLREDSIIIIALCHDICKEGLYKKKSDGKYYVDNSHPANHQHSALSVERIEKYIKLRPIEKNIILCHMGLYSCYEYGMEIKLEYLMKATKRNPLVQIFSAIDNEESHWQK